MAKGTETSAAAPQSPSGMVFVDAGSSGSKVCSFPGGIIETCEKVLTECSCGIKSCADEGCRQMKREERTRMSLKGVSALSYEIDVCQPDVHVKNGESMLLTEEAQREHYAFRLLEGAKRLKQERDICGDPKDRDGEPCPPAINKDNVPILATAGMRLLTREEDQKVWGGICGKEHGGYSFADGDGPDCGTISGTEEAYYEFLAANTAAITRKTAQLAGTVTIGGESAQIGVPLRGDQVDEFALLYTFVEEALGDCSEIKLPSGEPIQTFRKNKCARDFVDIVPLSSHEHFEYVGLISMLGLERLTGPATGRIGVSGGMNAIEKWALRNGCGGAANKADSNFKVDFDLEECENKFLEHLNQDVIFSQVSKFFHTFRSWEDVEFTFGTPAAIPHKRFREADDIPDEDQDLESFERLKLLGIQGLQEGFPRLEAWDELHRWLVETCAGDFKNLKWGVNQEQTPMKTLWAFVYFKALGLDKVKGEKLRGMHEAAMAALHANELDVEFRELNWAKGKLFDMKRAQNGQAFELLEDREFMDVILKAATAAKEKSANMLLHRFQEKVDKSVATEFATEAAQKAFREALKTVLDEAEVTSHPVQQSPLDAEVVAEG